MLDTIERVPLANLPTPLQEMSRLARALGLSQLLFKRDDLTDLAMGGNKARKLEYEFVEILRQQCDVVVTVGGRQSNHARMTAAAARKCGIDVKLLLGGEPFDRYEGNLLLEVLLGAEIRYLDGNDDNDALAAAMNQWVDELQKEGRKPYALPIGGSTGLGALGYVRAMRELAAQFGPGPARLILPVGSCGTLAGCILGARMFLPRMNVIGISVSRSAGAIAVRTAELIAESNILLHAGVAVKETEIECYDTYVKEYGVMTDEGKEAIRLCAGLEGVLLDPVYTGKAMAGLIDLVRRKILDPSVPTIFLHTGGLPGLFAYADGFSDLARCTQIPGPSRRGDRND
jgi:D-cysteine desulfhydrase family pyridoxal phosphate-dependent enzyme